MARFWWSWRSLGKPSVGSRCWLSRAGFLAAVALALAVVGCGLVGTPTFQPAAPVATGVPTPQAQPTLVLPVLDRELDSDEERLVALFATLNPSVVHIDTGVPLGSFNFPNRPDLPDGQRGLRDFQDRFYQEGRGSGFIFDRQGHVVTTNHLVADARSIVVTLWDGTTAEAEVVGRDPDTDLAVLRISVPMEKLQPILLAEDGAVIVGQPVVVLGNPFGLGGTMTQGVVSAMGRTLALGRASSVAGGRFAIPRLLQTDAEINAGNSGGPLVDMDGWVIGMVTDTRALSGVDFGADFAVAVSAIRRAVPALIEHGRYLYPWLGVSGITVNQTMAEPMNLPLARGAYIDQVIPDSPASRAGLRGSDLSGRGRLGGDVVIAIEGTPVATFDDLVTYLIDYTQVGQRIRLTIIRDGRQQEIDVVLGARPEE